MNIYKTPALGLLVVVSFVNTGPWKLNAKMLPNEFWFCKELLTTGMICVYSDLLSFVMLHLFILWAVPKQNCVESVADPLSLIQKYFEDERRDKISFWKKTIYIFDSVPTYFLSQSLQQIWKN